MIKNFFSHTPTRMAVSLILLSVIIVTYALIHQYEGMISREQSRLHLELQSKIRFFETVMQNDHDDLVNMRGKSPQEAFAFSLQQFVQAYPTISAPSASTISLSIQEGEYIRILLCQRYNADELPRLITIDKAVPTPMIRALNGDSGTYRGIDVKDRSILAAYAPVTNFLGRPMGMVELYDLETLKQQFIQNTVQIIVLAIILTLLAAYLVFRSSSRLTQQLSDESFRMNLAIDGANDGLWDWNLLDDTLYLSPRWKEIIGFQEYELDNSLKTWYERLHPDDAPESMEQMQAHLLQQKSVFDTRYRLKTKSGEYKWIRARGKAFFKDAKPIRMVGYHTDLSQEIALQEALTHEKNYLNAILNAEKDFIIVTRSGENMESCNQALLDFFGFETLDALKAEHQCICEFFTNGEEGYLQEKMGDTNWVHYAHIHPEMLHKVKLEYKERIHYFMVSVHPLTLDEHERFVVVLDDITLMENYQKELQNEVAKKTASLQESLRMLEESQKITHLGSWELDIPNKRISWTDECYHIFDLPKSTQLTYDFANISHRVHPDDRDSIVAARMQGFENGTPIDVRYRVVMENGSIRYVHSLGQPERDGKGTLVRFVGTYQDITERILMERMEREHEELQNEQHRLKSIQDFAQAIAHHWRQPLAVISISIANTKNLLERDGYSNPDVDTMLSGLDRELQYMSHIITQFRQQTESDRMMTTFSIKKVIEESISMAQAELDTHHISASAEGDETDITGYRHDLERIIGSMITNAKESILKKQADSAETFEGVIRFTISSNSEEITVRIRDNGSGIDPELEHKIFEPYYTTKFMSRGVGLSLYFCKQFIERQNHGSLTLNHDIPDGAEFIMRLPINATAQNEEDSL